MLDAEQRRRAMLVGSVRVAGSTAVVAALGWNAPEPRRPTSGAELFEVRVSGQLHRTTS